MARLLRALTLAALCALAGLAALAAPALARAAGSFGAEQPAGAAQQALAAAVRADLQKATGLALDGLVAEAYCTQVVAGTNTRLRLAADGLPTRVHATVFSPLAYTGKPPQLVEAEAGFAPDAPLGCAQA